jgi:G protein-coupled glucose receptor regulating Gpa2 C-term
LTYTDYYTAHPQFWLSICTTCILALQAGFDCVIFSWREKTLEDVWATDLPHLGFS